MAAGAKPHEVFASFTSRTACREFCCRVVFWRNVKSHLGGRLLSTAITQADLKAVGAEATDTEDVINRLLSVAGVEVALLFLELGPQETKVSLRSRSTFDVNQVADHFGGGGHKAASGVRYRGPLSEAEPAVLAAVSEAMQSRESRSRAESQKHKRHCDASHSTLDSHLSTLYHG